jgi:hypothetical protein
VQTIENAVWNEAIRDNPYSMILEYYDILWSQVIAKATHYAVSHEDRGAQTITKIALRHPRGNLDAVLFFDREYRLIERHRLSKPLLSGSRPDPDLLHKDTFNDYQQHRDESGEAIWFPHRAVYQRGFLGRSSDGTLLGGTKREITISEIKFNSTIPDSMFEVRIPRTAEVYDGITGMGRLPPGERPGAVFPGERKQRWYLAVAVLVAVFVGIGLLVAWRRRRGAGVVRK